MMEKEYRTRSNSESDDICRELILGKRNSVPFESARLRAINEFVGNMGDLTHLPHDDKRGLQNGIKILNLYFDEYLDDPFEILNHPEHGLMTEKNGEMLIYQHMFHDKTIEIWFHFQIDAIFQNTDTKIILTVDHKTTSSLGSDFYNRIKPNFQYIGYTYATRKHFGIAANAFMVNGIQIAKTKQAFARQVIHVTDDDIAEFKQALLFYTHL